jgi:phosphate transport system permease protein
MNSSQNTTSSGSAVSGLTRSPTSPRTLFGIVMTGLSYLCAAIALLPLLAVLSYVIIQGFSRFSPSLFVELPPPPMVEGGGFGNAIVGTLIMVGIATLLSVPFGIMAAVYLNEFALDTDLSYWIRFATNVLSGVPSIIVGVFAYGVVVLSTGGFSAWAGGFALSILMLPIIVRATEESLKLVPPEIRQAALGIGATNFQMVARVVLPAAMPAIVTGTTLAIARAAGETAPLLFTALFAQFWPENLFAPTPSLAVLVYNFATSPFKNQQELAWAASLVLVFLVLITSAVARWATARKVY